MNVYSTHPGKSVAAFPDVCKTPTPGGPVPIPYPNAAGYGQPNTTASKAAATGSVASTANKLSLSRGDEAGTLKDVVAFKQARGHQLRGQLQSLHMQIATLPSGNPTRWHKLLDDYVMLTAELYKTLTD